MSSIIKKCCVKCAKVLVEPLRCSVCKTNYCSSKCQKKDWPIHKLQCKSPKTPIESDLSIKNLLGEFVIKVQAERIPDIIDEVKLTKCKCGCGEKVFYKETTRNLVKSFLRNEITDPFSPQHKHQAIEFSKLIMTVRKKSMYNTDDFFLMVIHLVENDNKGITSIFLSPFTTQKGHFVENLASNVKLDGIKGVIVSPKMFEESKKVLQKRAELDIYLKFSSCIFCKNPDLNGTHYHQFSSVTL